MSTVRSMVIAVAAVIVLASLFASPALFSAEPGVEVVKVSLKMVDGRCSHHVDGDSSGHSVIKKISKSDRDVLIWRLVNECREPQAALICLPSGAPLSCIGDPPSAAVGRMFRVEGATNAVPKVKSYVVCTVDWPSATRYYRVVVDSAPWGTSLVCVDAVRPAHEISIEIVP